MKLNVLNVSDVAERQLCCGCGACAYISPESIEMIDCADHGRRPRMKSGAEIPSHDDDPLSVCPGIALTHAKPPANRATIRSLEAGWGPVLEVWEGWAADPQIRFAGSSGGATSAISLACIESQNMHGVLHTRARADAPYLNETTLSTTRSQILQATGSRYAPASPCDGLDRIESAPAPCVFVGKPCDVAAVRKAQAMRPVLRERVGLTIAFFCAGTPTTEATLLMLRHMGIDDPSELVDLRYRGNGWPGAVTARTTHDGADQERQLGYDQAWGEILTNHKQWRCHVCPDHTGEFADIAVGDAWHRWISPDEPGRSLILVRTERGRRILRAAVANGYLEVQPADASALERSQPNLLLGRAAVWGRLLSCRLLGIAVPRYRGFVMLRFWITHLTLRQKLQSTLGVIRRVWKRRLHRRAQIRAIAVTPRSSATARMMIETASEPSHIRRAA